MNQELRQALYTLEAELRNEAENYCRDNNVDAVHYFITLQRKIQRMEYEISRRYPENNS